MVSRETSIEHDIRTQGKFWQALSHSNGTPFFINREKGRHLPDKFDMNEPLDVSQSSLELFKLL